MNNIHYIEDTTAFEQNRKTYLRITNNFEKIQAYSVENKEQQA